MHNGVDIAIPGGTALPAIGGGVVESVGYNTTSGNYIRIRMPNGDIYSYAHMQNKTSLKAGQEIQSGTVLGKVGSTGRSTGNHLHLRYQKKTKNGYQDVDPLSMFQ
jgi:murein DD-endopeptidase MepM/ murein hydrolase activator NlpD